MISLYVPGSGILHRLPAGVKLAGLAVAALAISLLPHSVPSILIVVLLVCAAYPLARLPLRTLRVAVWRMRWLVLVLGIALWLLVDALTAVIAVGRVLSLVLLADLLTSTTRMGELLDVLRRLLGGLRRFRVDPDSVALTISLTLAMVPVVAGFVDRVREAQRARGVRLGIRSAAPLLIMTLKHADEVGEALAARGVRS